MAQLASSKLLTMSYMIMSDSRMLFLIESLSTDYKFQNELND